MTDNYVVGYPPPPFYYCEYEENTWDIVLKKKSIEESADEKKRNSEVSYECKETQDRETYADNTENKVIYNDKKNNTGEMSMPLSDIIEGNYNIYYINKMKNEKLTEHKINELKKYHKENSLVLFGRPPPKVIKQSYNMFGINYDIERKLEDLDSDDLLYDQKKNLKEEFIRLYKSYKDAFFELFDDIVNNRKNEKSKMKHLTKIHTNLFHILAKLRYYQTVNNIINVLKAQLKRRKIAIDKMKISLLNVYQYINYVQTNYANDTNEDFEKEKLPKEKELKSITNYL